MHGADGGSFVYFSGTVIRELVVPSFHTYSFFELANFSPQLYYTTLDMHGSAAATCELTYVLKSYG